MEGQEKQAAQVGGGGEMSAPVDTRPTDVEVFLGLLPTIVGSYAVKNDSPKTTSDLAIHLARQTLGGLVQLGICRATTWCSDNQPLALGLPGVAAGSQPAAGPAQIGQGGNRLSGVAAHYPNSQIQRIQGL